VRARSEASLALAAIVGAAALGTAGDAHAVRFTLGLASNLTPIVVDGDPEAEPSVRFGLRPVLDVEVAPWMAFEAYAPFVLARTDSEGPASSGAESVFGIGLSGRYRLHREATPDEILFYGTLRGGFSTVNGRAGPFVGFASGVAMTWLDTGRGWFAELEAGHVGLAARDGDASRPEIDRWLVGLSAGIVFRLGGERWDL